MQPHMARALKRISGFLEPGDAAMVRTLLAGQKKAGLSGPVAEIGVHHGKLILTMAAGIDEPDRAVAIDIFDDQAVNIDRSGKGDLEIFERHVGRMGLGDRVHVIKGDSTGLEPRDLTALTNAPFRMFSVDGGHSYDVVWSDMRLASETLCEGGVILADDYFNYGWPDVSYAVAKFAQAADNPVFPFAASSSKLYLTNSRDWAGYYRDVLALAAYPSLEKIQRMGGVDVHVFDTRSVGSAAYTFVRILKARLRGAGLPGFARPVDRLDLRADPLSRLRLIPSVRPPNPA
jgi:hypothetical protein